MADNEPRSIVSLKDYVDARFSAIEKAMESTGFVLDRRLASMNEFREALHDQASRMPTRVELDASLAIVNAELRQLRDFRVALEAKASQQSVNIALALSLLGLLLSAVKLFSQ